MQHSNQGSRRNAKRAANSGIREREEKGPLKYHETKRIGWKGRRKSERNMTKSIFALHNGQAALLGSLLPG